MENANIAETVTKKLLKPVTTRTTMTMTVAPPHAPSNQAVPAQPTPTASQTASTNPVETEELSHLKPVITQLINNGRQAKTSEPAA